MHAARRDSALRRNAAGGATALRRDATGATMGGGPSANDVMALQTAASIENLAVATYRSALELPFMAGDTAPLPSVRAFLTGAIAHHSAHVGAFNAAVERLGGTQQTGFDPKYRPIMTAALARAGTLDEVAALAAELEDVAVATYAADVGIVTTPDLRTLFASVCGVEAQHRAYLLTVQVLARDDLAGLVAAPPQLDQLPSAVGVPVGDAFYPTSTASPVAEGAIA